MIYCALLIAALKIRALVLPIDLFNGRDKVPEVAAQLKGAGHLVGAIIVLLDFPILLEQVRKPGPEIAEPALFSPPPV